MVEQYSILRYN